MLSKFAADSVPLTRRALLFAVVLSSHGAFAGGDASHGGAAPLPSMPASAPAVPPGAPDKATASDETPRWALGLNLLDPVLSLAGSYLTRFVLTVAPVPVDLHVRQSDLRGIKGTLLYRYFKDRSELRAHEFALAAGPRWSLNGKGLEGLYLAVMGGVGFESGSGYDGRYKSVDLVLRAELAHAKLYANGVYLVFGAGLSSMLPVYETPRSIYRSTLTKVLHHYQPTVNFTLGYAR